MSKQGEVIAAGIEEAKTAGVYLDGDETLVQLETNCYLNMVGGQRPSDAARSIVRWYLRNPAQFRRDFHSNRKGF